MKRLVFAALMAILPSLGHSATLTLFDTIADGYTNSDAIAGAGVNSDYTTMLTFDALQDGVINSFEVSLGSGWSHQGFGYSTVQLTLFIGNYFTTATPIGITQYTITPIDPDLPDWISLYQPAQITAFHGLSLIAGQSYSLIAAWIEGDDAIWRTTYNGAATTTAWSQGEVWFDWSTQDFGLRIQQLDEPLPAVPVPASLPLIAGGLALLATVRKRRG